MPSHSVLQKLEPQEDGDIEFATNTGNGKFETALLYAQKRKMRESQKRYFCVFFFAARDPHLDLSCSPLQDSLMDLVSDVQ